MEERWFHIVENHNDLAGFCDEVFNTIGNPDFILRGYRDAIIGVRQLREKHYLSVVYREVTAGDGFVITAYRTSRISHGGGNMAKKALKPDSLSEMLQTASHLIKFPTKRFYVDYDEEADVLYLSFERPQNATDSQMLDNGVLLRYREEDLVGVTIFDASKR